MFKKIVIILLSLIIAWLLYNAIGYFIYGINTPIIYGNGHTTMFTGMFLMSITYFALMAVLTVLLVVFIKKYKGKKN